MEFVLIFQINCAIAVFCGLIFALLGVVELILDRFSELQEFTEASEDYDFLHCILLDYQLHSLLRVSFHLSIIAAIEHLLFAFNLGVCS